MDGGLLVWRDGVDNKSSILPFPLSLPMLSRNTKISDSREEVSAAATIKGFCKECGFMWSSPLPGYCCNFGSLSMIVEGLGLKLGYWGGEGFVGSRSLWGRSNGSA